MYSKKIATKANLCFICSKFTSTVLRNDSDYFYVCDNHLSDQSFCNPIVSPEESSNQKTTPEADATDTEQDTLPGSQTQEVKEKTLVQDTKSGFLSNVQKALFSQISFKGNEKLSKIEGYELTRTFQLARQQNSDRKLKKKQISEKNLELLQRVDDWPKVPKDQL